MAQDLTGTVSSATQEQERVFRQIVDGLEFFVRVNMPRAPVEEGGRGSLFVSALVCCAGRLLAEFPEALRGNALESAQDYLARQMHAQVDQDRKEREQCPSSSPAKISSN